MSKSYTEFVYLIHVISIKNGKFAVTFMVTQ